MSCQLVVCQWADVIPVAVVLIWFAFWRRKVRRSVEKYWFILSAWISILLAQILGGREHKALLAGAIETVTADVLCVGKAKNSMQALGTNVGVRSLAVLINGSNSTASPNTLARIQLVFNAWNRGKSLWIPVGSRRFIVHQAQQGVLNLFNVSLKEITLDETSSIRVARVTGRIYRRVIRRALDVIGAVEAWLVRVGAAASVARHDGGIRRHR